MNKKFILPGLAIVVILQVMVLTGEYVGAVYPLWTGQEVRLKTVPVDPRSIFRGNYARLRYDISTIDEMDGENTGKLRTGEIIYVRLAPGQDSEYVFAGAGLEKPEKGTFIRGRLRSVRGSGDKRTYDIKYGIEAYFAPKQKALAMEKELRSGGMAVVMVAPGGRATLKEVIAK